MTRSTEKPLILITNDDGIHSEGIHHLWKALHSIAETVIVAPATEKSCSGLSLTLYDPLHIELLPWEEEVKAWTVTGTPADCVRMALSTLLDRTPDLIASGINHGSNAGRNVLYSGTIGGVIEGIHRNIQGVAFSSLRENHFSSKIESYIQKIVLHMLQHPLPPDILLNVNFPSKEDIQGMKLVRQGRSYWMENPEKRLHPEGKFYYWLGGKWAEHQETHESDVSFLDQGFATAVPIKIYELTDLSFLKQRKQSFELEFEIQ